MGINKVSYGGNVLIDLTQDSVSEDNLLSGNTAHDKSGDPVEGKVSVPSKTSQLENDSGYLTRDDVPFYNKSIDKDFSEKFRTETKGDTKNGNFISNVRTIEQDVFGAPTYGAGIAWGSADTNGYIMPDYQNAKVFVGGGNKDSLKWIKELAFMDNVPTQISQLKNDTGYAIPGTKAGIWTDGEGGNWSLESPDGIKWEADAFDGNLRIFTHENGGKIGIIIDATGKATFPNTPVITSTSLTATIPGIPLDHTAGKVLKDEIENIKVSFQAGVDTLYNKCKSCGATPSAKTPAAISTAIQTIYTNRYNAGLNAGAAGKKNVWKSGEITAYKGSAGGKIHFSISNFSGYKNITKDNISVEFTHIVSGSAGANDSISYSYNKDSGEIIAQAAAGGFYSAAHLVYQSFKAKITVIY